MSHDLVLLIEENARVGDVLSVNEATGNVHLIRQGEQPVLTAKRAYERGDTVEWDAD